MLRVLVEKCGADVNSLQPRVTPQQRNGPSHLRGGGRGIDGQDYRRAAFWYIEALRYLVGKGADIHARDLQGRTPLHLAYGGVGEFKTIQLWFIEALLELGADPTIKDDEARTCTDVANSREPRHVVVW